MFTIVIISVKIAEGVCRPITLWMVSLNLHDPVHKLVVSLSLSAPELVAHHPIKCEVPLR